VVRAGNEMNDVSPDLFLDAVFAYQKTAAIKAAVGLDFFTAIAQEEGDLDRVAAQSKASKRGLRILCDCLTVYGFLQKDGSRYRLTPSSEVFLTRSSPAWMGSIVDFMSAPEMMALFLDDPASFVRNGGSVGLGNLAPNHPLWVTFAKAMVPFMAPVAEAVAAEVSRWSTAPRRALDVAAGHGMFGIAVGRAIPNADITATDWKGVLEVASENARQAGISDRHRTLPGSAFDVDWGSGFDLVLLSNFLHHFDQPTCIGLLQKARKSLTSGGRVLIVEFVPNEDRVSPPFPALFSFVMLGSTPNGDAYTTPEFEEMGRRAGFSKVTVAQLPPTPQALITMEAS
jgi:hypothetical protein